MTLAIADVGYEYVLHVSDRLVTIQGTGTVHDEAANKAVIYNARDAIVTVSYSGLAYIDDLHTDHWIASQLLGHNPFCPPELGDPAIGFSIATGLPFLPRNLGRSVMQLWEAASNSREGRTLEILIAGYQWKRSRRSGQIRPVAWRLGPSSQGYAAVHMMRYPPHRKQRTIWTIGDRRFDRQHVASLVVNKLSQPQTQLEAMAAVVDELRSFANSSSPRLVGDNYLAIFIPMPSRDRRWISVDFFPTDENRRVAVGPTKTEVLPTYTPVIVGPNFFALSSLHFGGDATALNLPRWQIRFVSPDDDPNSLRAGGFILAPRQPPPK